MKRIVTMCAVSLLVLLMAAPAAAVQPFVWYDEDFDDTYPAVGDCGDFTVSLRATGHHSEKLYFADKDYEKVVRTLYKARGTDYLINDKTQAQIEGDFAFTCHVDIVSDPPLVYVRKCTGKTWNITVPGKGNLVHGAGQTTEYVEGEPGASGDILKSVGTFWFDDEAVCAALR